MPDANDMNDIAGEVARRARDAAYVAVGLGVLGLQRAQVLRQELVRQERVDEGVARLRTGVSAGSLQIAEWLDDAINLVSTQLAPLGDQLPDPARQIAGRARTGLEAVSSHLRQFATPGA